jgi:hypothetical protein
MRLVGECRGMVAYHGFREMLIVDKDVYSVQMSTVPPMKSHFVHDLRLC